MNNVLIQTLKNNFTGYIIVMCEMVIICYHLNCFQNSQSVEKGFEETSDDTIFISYHISLQYTINFDKVSIL